MPVGFFFRSPINDYQIVQAAYPSIHSTVNFGRHSTKHVVCKTSCAALQSCMKFRLFIFGIRLHRKREKNRLRWKVLSVTSAPLPRRILSWVHPRQCQMDFGSEGDQNSAKSNKLECILGTSAHAGDSHLYTLCSRISLSYQFASDYFY